MWVCGLFLVATFTMVHVKVVEREIITSRKRVFYQTSDMGVSPQGRSSYVFKVKSCNTAIITLSNIKYIEKTKGRYFLFYLGRNFNTQLSLLDSCFGCPPKAVLRRRLLDCNVFKPFWVQWNDLGSVWFGAGHKAGHGILLSYTTPRPFSIMFSQVTTLESPSTWRFLLDYDVKFIAPAPDGSTTVFIKENVVVASYVYDFKVRPLVNTMLTSSNDYFMIFGTQILTKVPLNYESKRVHFLQLRTTEGNVSATLTVVIEDVNDEVPEINVISDMRIPEELPVGTLFSGCFVVSDKDIGDNLKLRLEGADAIYLDKTKYGQLQVKSRIDRDGPNGVTRLDDLILIVEDSSNHTASHRLRIDIVDVDDNEPTCWPDEASITISPTMSKQILVCTVKCSDLDVIDGETFRLKIYDDLDAENVFIISGTDVYIDADYLRERLTDDTDLTYVLKLLVVDAEDTSRETASSISIIVKIRIERPVVNDYPPYWISPPYLVDGRFFDLEIAETTAMGTVIRCFLAYDRDESPLMYHIAAIVTDDGNSANNTFKMDTNTGCLRTASVLDTDQATGGVLFYDLTISVTDGKYTSSGLCRVIIQNVNDNPPIFSRAVYHVSANLKNQFNRLAEFDVVDFDENTEVSLSLERGHHRFFKLMSSGGRWTLMFRPGIVGWESIPPVIKITAKDNWSTQMSSQVVVILEGLPCHLNASASRTENNASDGELAKSHTEVLLTSDHSTTPLFQTKSTQSRIDMTQSYKTNLERDFEIIQETTERSSLRFFLLSICVCLAVFNGLILALLIVIFGCRGCSLSKERQKTNEPTEITRKTKRPKMRRTIKIRPGNSGSVVCIVDIHEETRNVKIRKIKINQNNVKASTTSKYSNSDNLRQAPLNQKEGEEIREEINYSSKDRNTRQYSAENQYGKLSKSHHSHEGLEASYYDIESVEVMKTQVRDELALIQSNPFEANMNTIQTSSVDMAHSFTQVETLDYKIDVDCENFKDDISSGSDEEYATDGPGDSDNEDNVYNVPRSGDSEESMSDSNRQTPGEIHEEIQSSAAKHCFAVSDTRRCCCSAGHRLDISQVFHSSRGVEGSALSSKLFRSLLHQDRESKVFEEDILEVYADFLKAVVVYQGGRVSDVERSIKRFPRRTVHTFTIVYLPRVIFLTFLSQRLNNKQNLDCDIVEIHTRFLHASVVELEKHTLAVCRAKGTIFAMRHIIMTCLCQNCRVIEVSVNFLTQLDKTERQAYRFLDENVVAVIQSKNSFLVFLNKFLSFVESGISSEKCPNGQQGSQYWQPRHTFHSEYGRREMRDVCNVDSVGLNSSPSRDETFRYDQSPSLILSSEYDMKNGSYGDNCSPSYHSTTKGRRIGKTQMISSSYSTDETTCKVEQGHTRMSPGAIPTFPYLQQSSSSRTKSVGVKLLQHSSSGDEVKPDTAKTQTKATRSRRAVKATAAKSLKRKTKVKAWDKDVRDRLYGRVGKGRTDISKGKLSKET